jgi:erythromycin esterase-like protein
MIKLNEEKVKTLLAKDLKDGQLAVIVEDYSNYKGRIVQKYGDDLVSIGLPAGSGWSCRADEVTLEVRVLQDGETLTVLNNECYV